MKAKKLNRARTQMHAARARANQAEQQKYAYRDELAKKDAEIRRLTQQLNAANEKLESPEKRIIQLTLDAKQLREAREFVFNEDYEEEDSAAVIAWLPAALAPLDDNNIRMKEGLYCWDSEYPEEGCFPLFDNAHNSEEGAAA